MAQLKCPLPGLDPAASGEGHLPAHHSGPETKLTATAVRYTLSFPVALPTSPGGGGEGSEREFAGGVGMLCGWVAMVRGQWMAGSNEGWTQAG